jgi:MSHA biogenesis protein MshI
VGLFSTAKSESQIGIEFMPDGVAVAQVRTRKNPGSIIRSEFVQASGQEAQVEALKQWVRDHNLQKTPCVCIVADDDRDIYQVEKPEVEDAEMIAALTWKIKDLLSYDVTHAVVDSYPIPVSSKNKQKQVGVVAAREAIIGSYVEGIKATSMALSALDVHELVRSNLPAVRNCREQSMALLTLTADRGLLSVYHDTDLYVSRDFKIGINQLEQATAEDESMFDALLLELQRSLDYFESFYGIGAVTNLRVFPQLKTVERLAMYLQNLSNFDIEFITFADDGSGPGLEPHCFHAYCAALRDVNL